jgi:phosphoribosylformylglycinamidine (FGAM) synthase-like enzyme
MGDLGFRIPGTDDHCRKTGTSGPFHGPFRETRGIEHRDRRIHKLRFLHLKYRGETCAYIRMDLLESDFPQWEFEAEWMPPKLRGLTEPVITEPENHGALLHAMLERPNICCRNWIARQYDHEVQGTSVIKPLVGMARDIPSDAAVIRPVLKSLKGLPFPRP